MPDGADQEQKNTIGARTVSSIAEINSRVWDALANPQGRPFNPFVSFAFLKALETSESVTPEAGWAPAHLVLERAGQIIAAAPLYVKGHSQGEYIFDHHWADAFERAGGQYYPKLLCAAPFTPAPGPRLLTGEAHYTKLGSALAQIAAKFGVSSLHANFISADESRALGEIGFLERTGVQYHWRNHGYESFDDFLSALSSRKRKLIRRERRCITQGGLAIHRLRGAEISERHWDAFWQFYQDTGARKWGQPYLTRTFFHLIAETMAENLVMIVAERGGEPIAGALNFIGGDALFGRYWGCTEDHPFLHFEICYYQAIDYAIEHKLARVEAGAQGEHKIARGYEPVITRSAHWIGDAGFRDAITRYLESERAHGAAEIEILKQYMPFRKC